MRKETRKPGEEQIPRPDGFSGNREARAGRIWGGLLMLTLIFALLTGTIRVLACSAAEMERAMRHFASPEYTRLPEAEYPAMAAHIADYLAGRKDDFQYMRAVPGGEAAACFHDYEIRHMEDCRSLIRLDGILCIAALAVAVTALGRLALMRKKEKQPDSAGNRSTVKAEGLQGARTALWAFSILAASLVLWAVIDFDGLFITFHRVAFRNDLWLLNPRTDLLIRLMPQELFISLGLRGLCFFLAGTAFLMLTVMLLRRRENAPQKKRSQPPESSKEKGAAFPPRVD